MGLSAHLRREGFCALSVKMALPVEQRREAIAESFLSVKPSPRGKTHSVRVTPLSVMGLNPVVGPLPPNTISPQLTLGDCPVRMISCAHSGERRRRPEAQAGCSSKKFKL
jgi:hypothetical protein